MTASLPTVRALALAPSLASVSDEELGRRSPPLPVVVLKTASGAIALGCSPSDYTAAGVAGKRKRHGVMIDWPT